MKSKLKIKLAGILCAAVPFMLSVPVASYAANKDVHEFSIQTAVPSASLYFKLLQTFSKPIGIMSDGRPKAEVMAAGPIDGPSQIPDAVGSGRVKSGYGGRISFYCKNL